MAVYLCFPLLSLDYISSVLDVVDWSSPFSGSSSFHTHENRYAAHAYICFACAQQLVYNFFSITEIELLNGVINWHNICTQTISNRWSFSVTRIELYPLETTEEKMNAPIAYVKELRKG